MKNLKKLATSILLLVLVYSCQESEEISINDPDYQLIENAAQSEELQRTINFLVEQGEFDPSNTYVYVGNDRSALQEANERLNNEIYRSLSKKFEKEISPEESLNARKRCNDGVYEESYKDGGGNTRWQIIAWECPEYGSGRPSYFGIIDFFGPEPNMIDAGPSGGGGGLTPNNTPSNPTRTDIFEFGSEKETLEYLVETAQDPDAARKRLLEYLERFGGTEGKEFVSMYNELWNTPNIDYADKLELNKMAYNYKQQLVAQYFMAIFSPENVGIIVGFAITPNISSTLRTRAFNVLPRYLSKSTVGQGYSSFTAFKNAHGSAGTGKAWHHIVEQNKIGQFSATQIHNTKNLVVVEAGAGSVHARITGYYGSIQRFTNGQTVRNWMNGKSFAEQMEFGLDILYRAKNGLPFP